MKAISRFKFCRKGSFFILLLIIFTLRLFAQTATQTIAEKKVPVIELKGSGYQRGLQHGTLLKGEIAEEFKKWKANIREGSGRDADSMIKSFYASTNFEPIIKRYTPDAYEEVKGIAKGSGQSYLDVYCFQMADEFWVYLDKLQHKQALHCSGIGIAAANGRPAYIAQNLDVESYMYGYQVLLHIAADKTMPEQYILTSAGLIAMNGINSKSIGICVNTLMELNASTDGLPVAFVLKGVLAKQNGADAIKFLTTVKHASGQNYILGIKDSVYDFEASAGKVVRFIPNAANHALVYHTNHAIANNDIKPWYLKYHQKIMAGEAAKDNSVIRFAALNKRLTNNTSLSDKVIKQTLQSKDDPLNPVCVAYRPSKAGFTFSSDIFTLGNTPSVQLTFASPDQSVYVKHVFTAQTK
jgi:isopenicillin-N N-acyltransferase-like protein